jgi:hypothetical protein
MDLNRSQFESFYNNLLLIEKKLYELEEKIQPFKLNKKEKIIEKNYCVIYDRFIAMNNTLISELKTNPECQLWITDIEISKNS